MLECESVLYMETELRERILTADEIYVLKLTNAPEIIKDAVKAVGLEQSDMGEKMKKKLTQSTLDRIS